MAHGGVVIERHEGTPQGGPLSPLLANVLLDEVDKELEKRGHCFVRYADDCNVYVQTRRSGERVMRLLRRLFTGLKLRVNESKSAVDLATRRKILGYSFWVAPGRRGEAPGKQESTPGDERPCAPHNEAHTGDGASLRLLRNCGAILWAGRNTTGSRTPQGSSVILTNGSAIACVRST